MLLTGVAEIVTPKVNIRMLLMYLVYGVVDARLANG